MSKILKVKARQVFDSRGNPTIESEIFTKNNTSQRKPLLNFFIDRYVDAYRLQLDELALYSRTKKSPISSFEDGRRALILANAAYESLKSGKVVDIKFE